MKDLMKSHLITMESASQPGVPLPASLRTDLLLGAGLLAVPGDSMAWVPIFWVKWFHQAYYGIMVYSIMEQDLANNDQQSTILSIYLSVCLSIYLSVCLSIILSIYLSVCLSIYLSIYIYIYIWANYNDLTATSLFSRTLEPWFILGESSPNGRTIQSIWAGHGPGKGRWVAELFRFVKYYDLPRWMFHWIVVFYGLEYGVIDVIWCTGENNGMILEYDWIYNPVIKCGNWNPPIL